MENLNIEQLSQLVQDVHDGKEDPLKAYAILKDCDSYVKKCIDEINTVALEEAMKNPEKKFLGYGYWFEFRNGASRYDYSNIPEIVELEKDLKKMKLEARNRCKTNHQILSEDGEILPKPLVSYNKDSLSVKFNG